MPPVHANADQRSDQPGRWNGGEGFRRWLRMVFHARATRRHRRVPNALFPCTLCCPERWVQVRTEMRPAARDFLPCMHEVMLEIAI